MKMLSRPLALMRPGLVLALGLIAAEGQAATKSVEQPVLNRVDRKFPVLTIETLSYTNSYTNATVTPSAKDVFIKHAGGIETLKVATLPNRYKEMFGYEIPQPKTNTVTTWTKSQVSKIHVSDLKNIEEAVRAKVPLRTAKGDVNMTVVYATAGVVFFLYLFFCFVCKRICEKSGTPATPLIWIPILQALPLFKAAGMPAAWLLASLLPVLNVVAYVVWCFKIAQVRRQGFGLALALLVPISAPFGFLYLAFGEGAPAPKAPKEKRPELMTLEAA